jgi:hypothetical protein
MNEEALAHWGLLRQKGKKLVLLYHLKKLNLKVGTISITGHYHRPVD